MESCEIPNSNITASSYWAVHHEPYLARLHLQPRWVEARGWESGTNDVNQWLQVDLGIKYGVTRVATQGRPDYPQWVKKYSLLYSDDGVTFHNYMNEQGQTKVNILDSPSELRFSLLFFVHNTTRVHNTFLKCLRDASRSVCYFNLVQRTREVRSPVIPKPASCSPCESPIAQWLKSPTGIWKVVGSSPAGISDLFFRAFLSCT